MTTFQFSIDRHQPRNTFSLNGTWEISGGDESNIPKEFASTIPVPAVVDTAFPPYDWQQFDYHWYRAGFSIDHLVDDQFVFLRISQSMFGTEVWLNGHHLGGSISCYTSHEYPLNEYLHRNSPNELIVRVGAKQTLPPESAVGRDQEKEIYTPGIWGDVSLICTGSSRIKLTQIIPHIDSAIAEVRVWLEQIEQLKTSSLSVSAKILEKNSGVKVSDIHVANLSADVPHGEFLTFAIPIQEMKLWSPQKPFLYEAKISVARLSPTPSQREGADAVQNSGRFGYQTADSKVYHLLKQFALEHRKNPTQAEAILWEHLKSKTLENYKFRRQHIIGRYITDFVCLSKNLVIEIDGLIHQLPENKESDEIRTQWLEEHGYRVIRFTNNEVLKNLDEVKSKILESLQEEKVPSFGGDLGEARVDECTVTFGMREFKIVGPDFYLNGSKILLRGGNIAFHRFLSDRQRKLLPWDAAWIKKVLIDIPKEHNFNFFRNHLGQMYTRWYDVADEYGMLLQNEWQFWCATGTDAQIRKEFTEWLHDNWNHPSIVIWDPLNESSDATVQNEIVPEMKKLDPTRPWESVDFLEEHPYIYSLGMVLNDRKFGFARSLGEIEHLTVPSMINEFLWWWFNDTWEPTLLTRDIVERWMGRKYSKDDIISHQSFLAQELIELFRRMRVKAIQPFVYLSNNDGPTAHWFLGDIKDLQPKPVLRAVKNAFAPFGVSIELWDRHFFVNERRAIRIFVFNDSPTTRNGKVYFGMQSSDGTWMSKREITVRVDPVSDTVLTQEVIVPDVPGDYSVHAALEENSTVVAVSSKIAHLFEQPRPQRVKRNIVVFDPSGEINEYLSEMNIRFTDFKDGIDDAGIVLIHGNVLSNQVYQRQQRVLSDFVKKGGTIVLIEPEFRVVGSVTHTVVDGIDLKISHRADLDKGGYDSYVFAEDHAHPLWNHIRKEHLKFFNGAYGGEIVSQYDVDFTVPSKRLASCGLHLNVAAASEVGYGKGKIILFRLQLRGRLKQQSQPGSLYARRADPVAQQLLFNIIEY